MRYYITDTGEIDRALKGKTDIFSVKNSFRTKREAKTVRDLVLRKPRKRKNKR